MQSVLGKARNNLAYVFVLFGLIWVALAYVTGSLLVLWPAAACVVAGALIRIWPSSRISTAWAPAAAILGLLLCSYQVYEAVMLLSGAFVTVASISVVIFLLLGIGHLYLAFATYSPPSVK